MARKVTALFSDTDAAHTTSRTWLSGKEVLRETGIDSQDLIRFIQLGALPKAMMRVSTDGGEGGRRKSYFSVDILEHVSILKQLRDHGHSIEEIAREMQLALAERPEASHPQSTDPPLTAPEGPPDRTESIPPQVFLLAETIGTAAFYVTPDLRIGWIKPDQNDRLSVAISNELSNDPDGTVMDILLRASLKELVFNWPPLFSFTYHFLKETTPTDTFQRLAPTVSLNMEDSGSTQHFIPSAKLPGPIDSCPIRLEEEKGQVRYLRCYGIDLAEGTLFILDEDRWQHAYPLYGLIGAGGLAGKGVTGSGKRPFSVLSARLDDSRNIVDTLLPETYYRLMTRIWDESDRIVGIHGGQRANRSGTEVQYIIPRRDDTDPAYEAIRCAFALRQRMAEIETELKAEGGWSARIRLNIGISSGSDHFYQEDLTASMAFLLPGAAADQAFHLATLARGGAIWITKSAFSHLTPWQMERITFGIFRDHQLVPNIFAQISELPQPPGSPSLEQGIGAMFATRILSLDAA